MIVKGDCLRELKKIDAKSVDLVYLDPPFFTQKKQSLKSRDSSREYSFEDTWENIESYQNYMRDRLTECRRVLKDSGSIFLHCDRTASHYLRVALDEVFGINNFRSEIVWSYKRWSNAKKGLLNAHQIIHFYSKTGHFKFNRAFESYSPTTNIDQIFQKRMRDENGKTRYKRDKDNNHELIEQKKGVPLSDVWEIPYLNPKANERVGYPTQKPIILLEKIIQLTTNKGDVVLDPFCGSGTTLVAAALLGRKYIGIDISQDAIDLTKKRLANPIRSDSLLLKNGKGSYLNQDKEILDILDEIGATPVQRNKGIDGFLKIGDIMRPIPIRIQRELETLEFAKESLLKASKRNGFKFVILIKTNDRVSKPLFHQLPEKKNKLFVIESINAIAQIKDQLATFV